MKNIACNNIWIIPLALFLLFASERSAAQGEYKFRTLSPLGGYAYDGVNDTAIDGVGFVWALLETDLIRFDGYEYKRYYSHFKGKGVDSRLMFHDLVSDSAGRLYVSCVQGLFRYDRQNDSFEKLLDRPHLIFSDARDNLWVRQEEHLGILRGVDSLDIKTFEGRPVSDVFTTETCADGSFLVASYYGNILRYDYDTGTFTRFHTFPAGHFILKIARLDDKLWVLLRDQGLVVMDIATGRVETAHDFPTKFERRAVISRDMLIDRQGLIWIATQQGVWVFNPGTLERHLYRHSEVDTFSIPHNSVRSVEEDSEGNIWIGTFSGGLCMVDPRENKSFTTWGPGRGGLSNNMVSAFAEDDNALWIGTEGGGVNRLDKRTGEFTYIATGGSGAVSSTPGNHIKSLVRDGTDHLWIATYLGGLMRYNIASGSFRYFNSSGAEDERLLVNDLRRLVPEGDKGLWICYQMFSNAVSFMPYDGGPIEHYRFDGESAQWFIWDMCRSGNYLWIVSQQKLYRMDVRNHCVVDVSSEAIPFLNGQSVCADGDGNVWIGTVGGTLLRYDPAADELTAIPGLADYHVSTVYSLCFDEGDNLWMGTDNGLLRHTPRTGKYLRFDSADGAQGHMYNPLAAMLTAAGRLLFGGTNGFSMVAPRAITENDRRPKAIISRFTVNNAPVSPRLGDEAPETYYGREIVLSHRETNFGFRLSSDNYLTPSGSRYRYRLEGYDTEPVTVGADGRTVVYSNVPPEIYRFEAAASVDGETWSEPLIVKVVRRPAPWNSRVAWILYGAVMLAIAGTIIYYYMERRRLAMQLYIDSLEGQKKEEIHQSQLRFFTNISHDFRTPLSLILGAVDNLGRKGNDDPYYRIVGSNSQRLLGLVNELMDFRTVENGMMRLQVQPVEVNRLVRDISVDFYDFAREKNINFRLECDEGLSVLVYIDRAVVEKIVMNLLNNALKYTPRGGTITISTHAPDNGFRNRYDASHRISGDGRVPRCFTIAISDTGVGISKESISKVFERFYKVNTANADSHLGTGIGLALVKSLVLLHKGAITIFSERDKGTDMVVELPFDNSVYERDEFFSDSDSSDEGRFIAAEPDERLDTAKSAAESMLIQTRKRILLVEDNSDLRMLIADFLSSEYEVVQAADGLVASEWLATGEADLIISDIMMPGKDGVALCREVKESIATSHIPFILLTAKTDIASKIEGTGSGADLYFEKPVDFNLLTLSIGNIFSRQNKLREHYSKNHFVDSGQFAQNRHDNTFLKKLIDTIDRNLTEPVIDVGFIASELSMSRTKLYSKVKALTGKSIVELILNYRMRKAARLILEEDMSIQQVMDGVGIRSRSYFTREFKEEFGETPSAFAKSHGKHPLHDNV